MAEKTVDLDKLIRDINAKFGGPVIQRGSQRMYVDRIPFSSPRLNYMTYGGVPVGMATELIGPESSGKTTTALDICAQAQKKALREWNERLQQLGDEIEKLAGRTNKDDVAKRKKLEEEYDRIQEQGPRAVLYCDAENTLDLDWAKKLGVDTDNWYLMRPQHQTAEEVLQALLDLIRTGRFIAVFLDSIPMLVSQKVFDKTLSDKQYAGIADAMARFCSLVSAPLSNNRTALIMINQVREDMENPYNLWNTPGGRALRHLYALRLGFRRGSFIDENNQEVPQRTENPAGNLVDVTLVKTKICRPDRRVGQYTIRYDTAIDVIGDTVLMALKFGLIEQSGAWFTICRANPETGEVILNNITEDLRFQGRPNLIRALREDPYLFEDLYNAVHEQVIAEE